MSPTVEFVLKLKDMMSGGMRNVASVTQSAFAKVNATLNQTTKNSVRSVSEIGKRLDDLKKTRELSVDLRQIRQANREMERLERQSARLENLGRSRRGGGMGMMGRLAAGASLVAGLGFVANSGLQAQATSKSFEVIAGAAKGQQLYKDLTKFAQDSIFGNELYKDAQTMLAFGVNVDKVLPKLKELGDVSMGDKNRLQSLALVYSQVIAAGKLQGQDKLQFVNAGWNPIMELAKMTGKSQAQLNDAMENGKITADLVTKALDHATHAGGMFFQMTDQIGRTDFGKWEALKGQVEGVAMQLGGVLAPTIGQFITTVGVPFVNWLGSAVGWIAQNWSWLRMLIGIIGLGVVTFKAMNMVLTVYKTITEWAALRVRLFSASQTVLQAQVGETAVVVETATVAQRAWNLAAAAFPYALLLGGLTMLLSFSAQANDTMEQAGEVNGVNYATKFGEQTKGLADTVSGGLTHEDAMKSFRDAGIKNGKAYAAGFSNPTAPQIGAPTLGTMQHATALSDSVASANRRNEFYGTTAADFNRIKQIIETGFISQKWTGSPEYWKSQGKNFLSVLPNLLQEAADKGKPVMDAYVNNAGLLMKTLKEHGVDVTRNGQSLIQKGYDNAVTAANAKPENFLGTNDLAGSSGKISGGGVRAINITVGKFWEDLIFYVNDTKDANGKVGDKVSEGLSRLLYSAGTIQK